MLISTPDGYDEVQFFEGYSAFLALPWENLLLLWFIVTLGFNYSGFWTISQGVKPFFAKNTVFMV